MASIPRTEPDPARPRPRSRYERGFIATTRQSQPNVAMVADVCDRCGGSFPHTEANETGQTFCEPCRDALWRDERGLPPLSAD